MEKSAEAFRTISEVAEILDTPAHVLRFWESRFPQIRPVKRAGGRRYYRPADVALLAGIRRLLHDEGMTIRGVQKILREQGVRHVASLSGHDPGPAEEDAGTATDTTQSGFTFEEPAEPRGEIVPFREAPRPAERPAPLRAEALPRPPPAVADRPPELDLGIAAAGADAAASLDGFDGSGLTAGHDLSAGKAAGALAGTSEPAPREAGPPVVQAPAAPPKTASGPDRDDASTGETPTGEPQDRAMPPADGSPAIWSPPAPLVPPAAAAVAEGGRTAALAPVEAEGRAAPPQPAVDRPPAPPEDDSLAGDTAIWRPALLRALPRGALSHRKAEVERLREALLALRDRLQAGPPEPRG